MMYRFNKTAYYHKSIITNDNQEERSSVKSEPFRVFEQTGKVKGTVSIIPGSESSSLNLILQTDNRKLAEKMRVGDYITYENYKYTIQTISYVRSHAYLGAREYLIGLK